MRKIEICFGNNDIGTIKFTDFTKDEVHIFRVLIEEAVENIENRIRIKHQEEKLSPVIRKFINDISNTYGYSIEEKEELITLAAECGEDEKDISMAEFFVNKPVTGVALEVGNRSSKE